LNRPSDLRPLNYALSFVPTVTAFDFSGTPLSRDMLQLVHEFTSHPRAKVTSLSFQKSFQASSVGDVLAEIIAECPTLTTLDLSENPLGERDDLTAVLAALVSARMNGGPTIITLRLANTRMGDQHCHLLTTLVSQESPSQQQKPPSDARPGERAGVEGLKVLSLARNTVTTPISFSSSFGDFSVRASSF